MENPTRTLFEEQTGEGIATRVPGSSLTQAQKEATIQKWADWILKQREDAAQSKLPEGRARTKRAEPGA
jgi:hypothetical protein